MSEPKKIRLFTNMQMWYHKHVIHFIIFFVITGLPLISNNFAWVAYLFGVPFSVGVSNVANGEIVSTGIQVCRAIHRFMAVLWIVTSIPFVLTMLPKIAKWNITPKRRQGQSWSAYIKEGLEDNKRIYIDWQYPKYMGKYSFLQIVAAWAVIIVCLIMMITGVMLWFRTSFDIDLMAFIRVLHFSGFIIIILFLMFHIYFAILPANRAGYNAIFRDGKDTEAHARKKHPGLFNNQ